VNLRELLAEFNIPTAPEGHHHSTSGWVQIDCPSCSPGSGRYRLGINEEGLYASCWTCGSVRLSEAIREITGEYWSKLRNRLDPHRRIQAEIRAGKLGVPYNIGPLLPAHRAYLEERGFDPDQITNFWGVKGIGISATYGWRLWIPVILKGETVSWTTRSLLNDGTRYLSAPPEQEAIPLKSVLYGLDHVRNTVVVHEGPTDVWAIGPGATCTFGLAWTKEQATRLGRYPRRVICFDNEPQAQRKAEQLCRLLEPLAGETIRIQLAAKDAGSAKVDELKELRRFLE
jgi:hypothetical protein